MVSRESRWFEASLVKCYCIRWFPIGEVSELADEHDLGSCAGRRGGSSPPFPTMGNRRQNSRRRSNSSVWWNWQNTMYLGISPQTFHREEPP